MLRSVVRFARDVARLPSFPAKPAERAHVADCMESDEEDEEAAFPSLGSVVKVVATDQIPGQVLVPDVWLALLPFQDLTKKLPVDEAFDRIQKRRTLLDILLRVAASEQFRWGSSSMSCGEAVGPKARNAFWIDLLRALSPRAVQDPTMELERNLMALSRARRPRFLLCFAHDVTSIDFPELLGEFLSTSSQDIAEIEGAYMREALDVLDVDGWEDVDVEIGLSFIKGKISAATLARLLRVIDKAHAYRGEGVRLRVTTLRFSGECSFPANALELWANQRRLATGSVRNIRIGSLSDIRVAARAEFFVRLLRGPSYLRSISASTEDTFVPLAAAARYGGASLLQELDLRFTATNLHASWLAFAFFHVDSRSTVSSICLRLPRCMRDRQPMLLTEEWLMAFKRTLHSVRAEQDLANMEVVKVPGQQQQSEMKNRQTRTFVSLRPNISAKTAPAAGAKALCNLGKHPQDVELLVRFRSSCAIVVPGAGVGWVPLVSIVSERVEYSEIVSGGEAQTNGRVTSFTWDGVIPQCSQGTEEETIHRNVLVELLSIIGAPLRRLHLPASYLITQHLAQIVKFCPNLTELNISGHNVQDIRPLKDVYASGRCKISSLSIAGTASRQETPCKITSALTSILEHGGRGVLRQLVTDVPLPDSSLHPAQEHQISRFAKAVSSSSNLDYLQVAVLAQTVNSALLRLPVDFSAHPLSFSPMPLRAKLAFLSVMYRFQDQRSVSRLDSSVLGVIFRFSDVGIPRRVLRNARVVMDTCKCSLCAIAPRTQRRNYDNA